MSQSGPRFGSKEALQLELRECLLRKKAERLRLNVTDEKATRKTSVLTLGIETETASAGRHAFIVKSLVVLEKC